MIYVLMTPVFAVGGADKKDNLKALNENQKIMHVLNRLGFGARPEDVEKVKAMGLNRYIDEQLDPNSIDDRALSAKLDGLDILDMTTAEIFAKFPNPGALLRQLEGGKRQAAANNADEMTDADKKARRQKLQKLYKEYDLRPANQIMYQQTSSRILRATYSEKQLQEVMVDFWMNHFNVYAGKAAVRWYIPSYERDVIRKNALGNFKDLVVGTAQHPAMLFYLDNFQSVSPDAQNNGNKRQTERRQRQLERIARTGQMPPRMRENLKKRGLTDEQIEARLQQIKDNPNGMQKKNQRGINENYARELMELHTLGVDGGYTQNDIVEVAKAFTGWTIADPRGYTKAAANMINDQQNKAINKLQKMAGVPDDLESGEFYFNASWHDKSTKTVLGQKVNAGGVNDGLQVIDILVKSPATAKFIAKKLAVKFVSDNPSEALVNRVAASFTKSNGNIKATLKTLFTDEEFYAPENYRAKIKTPFELMVSSLRVLGADVQPNPTLPGLLNKMGEPLYGYQAPTGYPDTAEDWVNTGALLERMNFAVALASNRIPKTNVNLSQFNGSNKSAILDKSIGGILSGDISGNTKAILLKQIEQPLPEVKAPAEMDDEESYSVMQGNGGGGKRRGGGGQMRLLEPRGNAEVFKIVGLIIGSPDFQRQ